MSSVSVELKTASPPSQGKFEVNANVETPKSGTPGTYRQLQTNVRGDSPSSTLSPSAKITSEMDASGRSCLPESVDNLESPPPDVGVSISSSEEHGEVEKQMKHDKVSSSEDEEHARELDNEVGGKFVRSDKKKRRIHLSFPKFGAKGKKSHHDTNSVEVPEKKMKQDIQDGDHVDINKTMEDGQTDEIIASEQESWNVNTSGCGAGTRANMAATGQVEQPDHHTPAGVAVSTGCVLPGDEEFNEQSQDSTNKNSSGEVDFGGSGGIHTAAPPFLDAGRSEGMSILLFLNIII